MSRELLGEDRCEAGADRDPGPGRERPVMLEARELIAEPCEEERSRHES